MSLADGEWFKVSELACHDGTPYPEEFADRLPDLMNMLDAIRNKWGGPIQVVSGYRMPEYNAQLAADSAAHQVASGSQHMEGRAADIRPALTGDASILYRVVRQMIDDGKLPQCGGIGLYPRSNWVHVDTFHPPDGHLRTWLGS